MGRTTRLRWIGLVATLSMLVTLTTGCNGNRRGELATGAAGSAPTATTDARSSGAPASSFGDLPSPCGAGTARGATDRGVTDTAITIGYGDDAGAAAAPGLNHELGDAVKAMIAWCNAQGGINGRRVTGRYYDAKLTEVGNVMLSACSQAFMLVGEGYALDSSQEETRLGCGLPAIPGYAVSGAFSNAPLMYQPVPSPVDAFSISIAGAIAKRYPDRVRKAAVFFGNFTATIDTKDKAVATYPSVGFKFLDCPQEYNLLGEPDWKPFALKLKNCGAQVVYFLGTPYPNFENYLEAADQVGYRPIYVVDGMYEEQFAKWNTKGFGDNVYSRLAIIPFEEASHNAATREYVDLVRRAGGGVGLLGAQAASAFLLWATATRACGANVTRACVLGEIAKVHDWTAGGLQAPADPGANLPPDCGVVMKLDGPKWVRWYPHKVASFDCSPSYVGRVTGRVVDDARLGPDRISRKFKP